MNSSVAWLADFLVGTGHRRDHAFITPTSHRDAQPDALAGTKGAEGRPHEHDDMGDCGKRQVSQKPQGLIQRQSACRALSHQQCVWTGCYEKELLSKTLPAMLPLWPRGGPLLWPMAYDTQAGNGLIRAYSTDVQYRDAGPLCHRVWRGMHHSAPVVYFASYQVSAALQSAASSTFAQQKTKGSK